MLDDIVSITINGASFSGWEAITITRSLDNVADAFSLSGPWDPENNQSRAAFKPFGYQLSRIRIDDELLLSGRVESVSATLTDNDRTINLQGRSLTGVLVDCSIDNESYQFQGISLLAVARTLCKRFGIQVVSTVGSGPGFKSAIGAESIADAEEALKQTKIEPGQTVFDYLNKLASDAKLLLTCNVFGNLVVTRISPGAAPVAALIEGQSPILSVQTAFEGASRFSVYKLLYQQDGSPDLAGQAYDAGVPIYRPKIETGQSGDALPIDEAAAWKRALALAQSITINVQLSGWRTPKGAVWSPGQVITLKSPAAMLYKELPLVVAEATLSLDANNGRVSQLRLVLPATYSGLTPKAFPWD